MAGVKGQPAPKPSQLSEAQGNAPSFEDFSAGPSAAPSFEDFAGGTPAPAAPAPSAGYQGPGRGAIEAIADYATPAGALIGGGIGSMGAGVGAIPGAALGAIGGNSLRRLLEINVLGKSTEGVTPAQDLGEGMLAGGRAAAEQAAGGLVMKGAVKAAQLISPLARVPYEGLKSVAGQVQEKLEKPVLEMLLKKSSQLTNEQSGDTVKMLLQNNIKQKYGKFIEAYQSIDDVAKSIPFSDASRYKFTEKIKAEALDTLGGDDLRVVRKFAEDINRVQNGAQIDNIMKQVSDAKRAATATNSTNRAKVLGGLEEQINEFLESNTTKLAAKMQAGKASPAEMQFIERSMAQRKILEPDATKYAKSIASDYLKSRDKIRTDYAGFREFLSDVGEQTGVRASNRGPMRFLNDLDSVPSEKLIEKMFDPKNARALRTMQAETPEVFDQVRQARVRQIAQNANPDGNLDLRKLAAEIGKSKYDSTRSMLFDKADMKLLHQTVNSPELKRVDFLNKAADNFIFKWSSEISAIADDAVAKAVSKKIPGPVASGVKQVIGKVPVGLADMMLPTDER